MSATVPSVNDPSRTTSSSGTSVKPASPDKNEQKEIHVLIENVAGIGRARIDELVKQSSVRDNHLVLETDKGEIRFDVLALPLKEQTPFWTMVGQKLGLVGKSEKLPPITVAINPRIYGDQFSKHDHVQLMALNPYAVMEDGTNYGLAVTVPSVYEGQWTDFQEPYSTGGLDVFMSKFGSTKTAVGRKKESLAIVYRADDGKSLVRQKASSSSVNDVYHELLAGIHRVDGQDDIARSVITKRTTVLKEPDLKVGEEAKSKSLEENLIFSVPPPGTIKGDIEDKKGLIEVVVFKVVEKEITEIIERPAPQILPSSGWSDLRGGDSLTMGGGLKGGGFTAGETTFGEPKTTKVNLRGVQVEEPIAAFRLVLVGEKPEDGLQMQPANELKEAV